MQAKALGSKHEAIHKGQYTYRTVIGKQTGDGETVSMEIIANLEELQGAVDHGFHVLDERMFLQNQRYLASLEVLDDLPVDLQLQVKRCIELAFGRVPPEDRLPPVRRMEEETPSA